MVGRGSALFCYRSDLPLGCWCGKVRSGGPQSSACVLGKGSVFPGPPGCLGRCSAGLRLDQGGRWRTWVPSGRGATAGGPTTRKGDPSGCEGRRWFWHRL